MKFDSLLSYFLLLVLVKLLFSSASVSFTPQCDVHERKTGRETPNTLLLSEATVEWLHPLSETDIKEYYERGKKECEEFLTRKDEIRADLRFAKGFVQNSQEINCFGRALLYNDFGMILWPFGPYQQCSTYSTCWFGILSCGNFDKAKFQSTTRPIMEKDINNLQEALKLPRNTLKIPNTISNWSLRSIVSHIRILGSELVSPDRRLYSFRDTKNKPVEAIIGKYVLTVPAPRSTLEIRLMEMYPSLLYNWKANPELQSSYDKYGLHNLGGFFLFGGSCKYFNHRNCPDRTHLPHCDNYSHLFHAPFRITVEDGLSRCSNKDQVQQQAKNLPICSRHNSPLISNEGSTNNRTIFNSFGNAPGRWLQGTSAYLVPNCKTHEKEYPSYNVVAMEYISDGLVPEMKSKSYQMSKTKIRSSFSSSFLKGNTSESINQVTTESSISPPIKPQLPTVMNRHNSKHIPADQLHALLKNHGKASRHSRSSNHGHSRHLQTTNITDITIIPPFDQASGNPCISTKGWKMPEELNTEEWFYAPYHCKYHFYTREELMQCFTGLQIHHIHFHGDSIARELFLAVARYLGVSDASGERLKYITNMLRKPHLQFMIEEENSNHSVLLSLGYAWEYIEEVVKFMEVSPIPDVYITNHYLAHRTHFPIYVTQDTQAKEWKYWQQNQTRQQRPRYLFFQNGRDLQGQRGTPFIGNLLRENSAFLRQMYIEQLGFMELDEFLLSMGKFENYYYPWNDGWHTMANIRGMEVIVFMNMICNDWWIEQQQRQKSTS